MLSYKMIVRFFTNSFIYPEKADLTNPGFLVLTTYAEARANVQMRVYGILRK